MRVSRHLVSLKGAAAMSFSVRVGRGGARRSGSPKVL